jgi:hypothetical protein
MRCGRRKASGVDLEHVRVFYFGGSHPVNSVDGTSLPATRVAITEPAPDDDQSVSDASDASVGDLDEDYRVFLPVIH